VRGVASRYCGGVATAGVSGPTALVVTPNRLSLRRLILLSLYWVAIGYLWNSIGAQVLPPIIRGFLGQAHQGTALSVLESIGTLIAVFCQPVIGALSDRTTIAWGLAAEPGRGRSAQCLA